MLVNNDATYSYITEQFFKEIKELFYEIKKTMNDKLIVANVQESKIIWQVSIPNEIIFIDLCRRRYKYSIEVSLKTE